MKMILRWVLYLLGFVLLLVIGFVAYIQIDGIPTYKVEAIDFPDVQPDSNLIALGEKIAAVQCVACHRGADGKLSGRFLNELPPDFGEIYSANITQSKEHGIGKWTDAQIAYLLRTGVKPDGSFLPNYMPKFPHLSDQDLRAVIAYLRSDRPTVQASETPKKESKPSFLTKFLCHTAFKKIPYRAKPVPTVDSTDAVAFGRYLVVGRYDCYPCHSADFKTLNQEFPEKTGGYLGGGNLMLTLNGNKIYTPNITMSEKTGIGSWTYDDFKNALVNSKSKNGKPLRNPMLPYNGLTETEITSMWQYLQTVPKIENEVNRQWDKEDL